MSTHLPLTVRPDTLDGLPPVLRRGLVAVSFFSILSLVSSSTLFIYLSWKLSRWFWKGQLANGANQFLLLIYNLLLADIQQSMAFALTTVYLAKDKIQVGSTTCWVNGWFVSTGDLASSVWIFSIALHTFLAVVRGRSISNKVFYLWLAADWVFVYALAIITVLLHSDTYVRAGAWCWVNKKYESERLWLHYFWIFLGMGGTILIYGLIFLSLRAKARGFGQADIRSGESDPAVLHRALKYMILYPVAYVVLTLPLAGGRMAAMTGRSISFQYYAIAGSAITSCGWLDVLLYVMTRRKLVFSHEAPPRTDFGFDTLGWKDGGHGFFRTETVIEGPITPKSKFPRRDRDFLGRSTMRALRTRNSDEDYFAEISEGVIATKTTVEVSTGPILHYASSDLSMIEMEDKPQRTQSPVNGHTHWPEAVEQSHARMP